MESRRLRSLALCDMKNLEPKVLTKSDLLDLKERSENIIKSGGSTMTLECWVVRALVDGWLEECLYDLPDDFDNYN